MIRLLECGERSSNRSIRNHCQRFKNAVTTLRDESMITSAPHHNGSDWHVTVKLSRETGLGVSQWHVQLMAVEGGAASAGIDSWDWYGHQLVVTDILNGEGYAPTDRVLALYGA